MNCLELHHSGKNSGKNSHPGPMVEKSTLTDVIPSISVLMDFLTERPLAKRDSMENGIN